MRTFVIQHFLSGSMKVVKARNLSHVVSTRFPGHLSASYNEATGKGSVYYTGDTEPRYLIVEAKKEVK